MSKRIRRDVVLRRLVAARDLISTKQGWTRDRMAADANGNDVDVRSDSAVSFCALGAIARATVDDREGYREALEQRVAAQIPGYDPEYDFQDPSSTIMDFNDLGTTGHRRRGVVAAFNRAITALQEELS